MEATQIYISSHFSVKTLRYNLALCRLQVKVELVGIDAILLVEGRELLYLKILDAAAHVNKAPPNNVPQPGEVSLSVAVTVGDVGLRDMQVCLVLILKYKFV